MLWAEGPAWSAQGRYLLWSDIPNNGQMRWSEDDAHVSVFRAPSNYSNGNSFDFNGRQLSCEHLTRRVVRYEHDGFATVLADSYNGKKLNSPNDVVAHPDGSYWFTDPRYGGQLYEGEPDGAGVKSVGQSAGDGGKKADHRGERVISRKAIAQGMSDALGCPVCSCAHFLFKLHTRPRVQRAPGIPCALVWFAKARAYQAARSRTRAIVVTRESG